MIVEGWYEGKVLRVNMGKKKVKKCQAEARQLVKSGKYPCRVCSKGVGSNSIQCMSCYSCNAWIHKRCSGIKSSLGHASQYTKNVNVKLY